jgi:hypothetical protein
MPRPAEVACYFVTAVVARRCTVHFPEHNPNCRSIARRLEFGTGDFLLVGDEDKEGEDGVFGDVGGLEVDASTGLAAPFVVGVPHSRQVPKQAQVRLERLILRVGRSVNGHEEVMEDDRLTSSSKRATERSFRRRCWDFH